MLEWLDLNFFVSLVDSYGYIGVFLASLIGNATIILPLPTLFVIFVAGSILSPFWVGIAGGIGAAIGEMTAYLLGLGIAKGSAAVRKKKFKKIKKKYRK